MNIEQANIKRGWRDGFIGQQFASWLGHPELRAETVHADGCFTIRVRHVTVAFSVEAYGRLKTCSIEQMPKEFEACLSR